MMADTDKRRMANYNFYTEQNWGKAKQLYVVSEQVQRLDMISVEAIIIECSK